MTVTVWPAQIMSASSPVATMMPPWPRTSSVAPCFHQTLTGSSYAAMFVRYHRSRAARRHQLGKSQEQLAQESSLHWSYLGQVERGQRNPTLHNILKLAEVLDVDPGELVHGLHAPVEDKR
jgi:DNA-binding XRE family transcriptional regulator